MNKEKWGYLRETTKKAKNDGIDPDTGLHRTGLEEYLAVIYPNTNDWIHDKSIGEINGEKCGETGAYWDSMRAEKRVQIKHFASKQHG